MKHNLEEDCLRNLIRESIEKIIQEEEYFDEKLPKEVKRYSNKYVGRQVTWYGNPDQMIVVHKSQVEGMWGNIYNPEKLSYIVELINNSEDNVEIECSYAIGSINLIVDVIEEQTAHYNDSFSVDYDGKEEPASTGDEELDEYLGNEEYIIDNNMTSGEGVDDFLRKNRFKLIYDSKSKKQLQAEFKNVEIDENDGEDYKDENDYEAFREFIKFEEAAIEAIENDSGDIGKFTVQLRDGHHRVMGAIKAGENYVCVNLDKDNLKNLKGHYQKINENVGPGPYDVRNVSDIHLDLYNKYFNSSEFVQDYDPDKGVFLYNDEYRKSFGEKFYKNKFINNKTKEYRKLKRKMNWKDF